MYILLSWVFVLKIMFVRFVHVVCFHVFFKIIIAEEYFTE